MKSNFQPHPDAAIHEAADELVERLRGCQHDLLLAADAKSQQTTIGTKLMFAAELVEWAIDLVRSELDLAARCAESADSKLANAILACARDAHPARKPRRRKGRAG